MRIVYSACIPLSDSVSLIQPIQSNIHLWDVDTILGSCYAGYADLEKYIEFNGTKPNGEPSHGLDAVQHLKSVGFGQDRQFILAILFFPPLLRLPFSITVPRLVLTSGLDLNYGPALNSLARRRHCLLIHPLLTIAPLVSSQSCATTPSDALFDLELPCGPLQSRHWFPTVENS